MMLIPCGHTLCKSCAQETRSCPYCYCSVESTKLNIVLHQVIKEYHTQDKIPERDLKSSNQGIHLVYITSSFQKMYL